MLQKTDQKLKLKSIYPNKAMPGNTNMDLDPNPYMTLNKDSRLGLTDQTSGRIRFLSFCDWKRNSLEERHMTCTDNKTDLLPQQQKEKLNHKDKFSW